MVLVHPWEMMGQTRMGKYMPPGILAVKVGYGE